MKLFTSDAYELNKKSLDHNKSPVNDVILTGTHTQAIYTEKILINVAFLSRFSFPTLVAMY